MADWVLSVFELNEYVRKKLNGDVLLQKVSVKGEISNLKTHFASGHVYFSLKDDKAQISCVMFHSNTERLRFIPENGMNVIISGQASFYTSAGQFQVYVEDIRHDGKGDIFARYIELKDRLEAQGLFDRTHKKAIPKSVHTIGVATSESGAVFHDIIKVARARNPRVNILIAPCSVQGKGAEYDIADSIRLLDLSGKCDVILVGRGGGSMEDLWPFNEEVTVRAIYECKTPIVSCIGHETDITLSEFAADVRASTPSNAAELAVNCVLEQKHELTLLMKRINSAFRNGQQNRHMQLDMVINSRCFKSPKEFLLANRLSRLNTLYTRMKIAENYAVDTMRSKLDNNYRMLDSLNPEKVKKRGYAIVRKESKIITNSSILAKGDQIEIDMNDGYVSATVKEQVNG